jgi:hypothetical protein
MGPIIVANPLTRPLGISLRKAIGFLIGLAVLVTVLPGLVWAQEEVASAIRRYKDREASTGYYEEYEAKPRRQLPLVEIPGVGRGIFPYSPSAAEVRIRSRLADSHWGVKFYQRRRCEDCHIAETRDIHTVRANLTCRQCHGYEPIAGIEHHYSPLNPIRKHAYVCAKCHQGASASYASYVVHAPNPAMAGTRETFPVLFYVFWAMIALAGGTFIVFLPHTALWGIRELFVKTEKAEGESKD